MKKKRVLHSCTCDKCGRSVEAEEQEVIKTSSDVGNWVPKGFIRLELGEQMIVNVDPAEELHFCSRRCLFAYVNAPIFI